LPLLKKSPSGRIVNLSSILGSLTLHADPASPLYHAKSFVYDASKTALNAFTIHLAYELRDTKIKVNSAHPGWVKTDMGGPQATLELSEGGKTSAALALLPTTAPPAGSSTSVSLCPGKCFVSAGWFFPQVKQPDTGSSPYLEPAHPRYGALCAWMRKTTNSLPTPIHFRCISATLTEALSRPL